MEYVEADGNSIDDAIERVLQRLGVSRDKVEIEIVSNATRGLFGLGGRRATVRATLRRPLAIDGAHQAAPRERALPETAVAPPAALDGARDRTAGRSTDARREVPPHPPTRPPRPPETPRRAPATPIVPAELDAAGLERARTVLAEIVRLTGSAATVTVAHDPDGVRLVITGDPTGVLIGRRGQTLDALEYVLHRIVAHDEEGGGRLVVDLEGYRLRRREALEQLARRVADQVRRRGKPVSLNPMSPRDRRVVHLALQDDPTLTTRTAGTGFYRKVVVGPTGARRAGRSRPVEQTE